MRALLTALAVTCGALALASIVAWGAGVDRPGLLITFATFACIGAGIALGKLESRGL